MKERVEDKSNGLQALLGMGEMDGKGKIGTA